MSRASTNLSEGYASIDFETDIIILGLIAIYRGALDPNCPVRHWGSDVSQGTLRVGNNRYRVGPYRDKQEGRVMPGLRVRVDINHYNGDGQSFLDVFYPFEALKEVNCSIRGKILGRFMKDEEPALMEVAR